MKSEKEVNDDNGIFYDSEAATSYLNVSTDTWSALSPEADRNCGSRLYWAEETLDKWREDRKAARAKKGPRRKIGEDQLFTSEVLEYTGIPLGTWHTYRNSGKAPLPDGILRGKSPDSKERRPYWNRETIDKWLESRPLVDLDEYSATDRLGDKEAAKRIGVKLATWDGYRTKKGRNPRPEPDGYFEDSGSPYWHPDTLDMWVEARKKSRNVRGRYADLYND